MIQKEKTSPQNIFKETNMCRELQQLNEVLPCCVGVTRPYLVLVLSSPNIGLVLSPLVFFPTKYSIVVTYVTYMLHSNFTHKKQGIAFSSCSGYEKFRSVNARVG
jgi:hypothetical protein